MPASPKPERDKGPRFPHLRCPMCLCRAGTSVQKLNPKLKMAWRRRRPLTYNPESLSAHKMIYIAS